MSSSVIWLFYFWFFFFFSFISLPRFHYTNLSKIKSFPFLFFLRVLVYLWSFFRSFFSFSLSLVVFLCLCISSFRLISHPSNGSIFLLIFFVSSSISGPSSPPLHFLYLLCFCIFYFLLVSAILPALRYFPFFFSFFPVSLSISGTFPPPPPQSPFPLPSFSFYSFTLLVLPFFLPFFFCLCSFSVSSSVLACPPLPFFNSLICIFFLSG